MEQDFDKLKEEMETKAKESFELEPFFHHNLNNFAYRYFDAPSDVTRIDDKTYEVYGLESKLKNALKTGSDQVRQGVTDLAKRVPYSEGPAVKYCLGISVQDFNSSRGGTVRVYARVNWGFPDFSMMKESYHEKEQFLKFEDVLILRNKLAKVLEEVASLIPS